MPHCLTKISSQEGLIYGAAALLWSDLHKDASLTCSSLRHLSQGRHWSIRHGQIVSYKVLFSLRKLSFISFVTYLERTLVLRFVNLILGPLDLGLLNLVLRPWDLGLLNLILGPWDFGLFNLVWDQFRRWEGRTKFDLIFLKISKYILTLCCRSELVRIFEQLRRSLRRLNNKSIIDNTQLEEIRMNLQSDFKYEKVSFLDTNKNSDLTPDLSPDLFFKTKILISIFNLTYPTLRLICLFINLHLRTFSHV